MTAPQIGSRQNIAALFLALVLALSLFPIAASAKDVVDVTQEMTLRVGETVTLQNPADNKDMAFSAYSWRVKGADVVSENHTSDSSTATVTALQPGRAIVVGYLDGCYAQTAQVSSNYNDSTHTWDKFHYTTYSENYTYTYRFHITVLNADGSQPGGAAFTQLAAQMEAEDEAAAEKISNTGSGTCGAGVTWTFDHGTLTVGGTGKMKDYDKYEMQPWYGYAIKAVIIRDGVTHVGDYAFSSGASANRFTTIETVILAGSVKDIGHNAFMGCTALETVTFSEGLTKIEDGAFTRCSSLKSAILPNSLKELEGAFGQCESLAYVYLPDGLTSVGTFTGCSSLTSVVIPASVTELVGFGHCDSLREVTILGRIKTIPDWAFAFCPSLETIYIPDSVTNIETFAFDVTETIEMDIYFEGAESQWKKAAFDSTLRRWHLPDGVTVHYNSTLPDSPEPVTLETPAELEALAKAAAGDVNAPTVSTRVTAYEMPQTIRLDGRDVTLTTYALLDQNGNATNYAKLRDVAALLSGTTAQFEVDWTQTEGILLVKGAVYTPSGSEGSTPFHGTRTGVLSTQSIKVSGKAAAFETLTLTDDAGGGYNYIKLRDLGKALGFNVCWNDMVTIESDQPYTG